MYFGDIKMDDALKEIQHLGFLRMGFEIALTLYNKDRENFVKNIKKIIDAIGKNQAEEIINSYLEE